MEYNFKKLEHKWQNIWDERKTYKTEIDASRPKYYILDMFPYPSGAGLHVGHPLGYIASDIYTRYKRLSGFNVLHPMGYDAFGLPAEQYAIQTGQHPAITTEQNIEFYRRQLSEIGFSHDPEREINTSDPAYYHWTQWAFIKMFESYFCNDSREARPISELIEGFESAGSIGLDAACTEQMAFSAEQWHSMNDAKKDRVLHNYRLAFRAETMVNWCQALGTVLANDEVINGFSERGGFPVVQRKMMQWQLRVTAYAERLLVGLDTIEWSESLKEIQRNWIGRSEGASMFFEVGIEGFDQKLEVFTTRADTIYGVTFMVLAPEHPMVTKLTTTDNQIAIEQYVLQTQRRTERERMADTKQVSGQFTGSHAINPISGTRIPIYISDYVLAGYGTGAVMSVPAHDSRDYAFARHFDLPIIPVVEGGDIEKESYEAKSGKIINSELINGLQVEDAIAKMLTIIEEREIGKRLTNYRLRDATFSRQRYWGEPIPIYYKDGIAHALSEEELPLELPEIDDFRPTDDGQPPLARAKNWTTKDGYPLETSTMPGFAGSSAYYLRYMDPKNPDAIVSREANEYWQSVDLYVGGIEHATGHLIYSRFWNKFLYDLGYVVDSEPFKKLVNQGMIQGRSSFVYRITGTNRFVSYGLREQHPVNPIHVDISIVKDDILDIDAFRSWRPEFEDAEFILEDGKYICGWAIEKMSKSMFNVVNPDDIIERYGADTLRMYEMFLGPLEQSKPWDTNGIDGVSRFLHRYWRLFSGGKNDGAFHLCDDEPTADELRTLHKTIKKVRSDIESFSFNTCVSAFMTCLNELGNCNKRAIVEPLTVLLYPFAPHITEELWSEALGHKDSLYNASLPEFNDEYLIEDSIEYPVSFNGKLRFKRTFATDATKEEIERAILSDEDTLRQLDGKKLKRIIVVLGRIVNIVM